MDRLTIGGVTVTVETSELCQDGYYGKPRWHYTIQGPGVECVGDDLYGWGSAREMLVTLLNFLSAEAERRAYVRAHPERDSGDGPMFPDEVGAWAEQYSDEIALEAHDQEDLS